MRASGGGNQVAGSPRCLSISHVCRTVRRRPTAATTCARRFGVLIIYPMAAVLSPSLHSRIPSRLPFPSLRCLERYSSYNTNIIIIIHNILYSPSRPSGVCSSFSPVLPVCGPIYSTRRNIFQTTDFSGTSTLRPLSYNHHPQSRRSRFQTDACYIRRIRRFSAVYTYRLLWVQIQFFFCQNHLYTSTSIVEHPDWTYHV